MAKTAFTTTTTTKQPSCHALFGMSPEMSSSSSSLTNRLDLHERFDRWRYLQKLLDEETDATETNQLLFQVLQGYVKYPRPKLMEGSDLTGSPERTVERLEKIQRILRMGQQQDENDGIIPLVTSSSDSSDERQIADILIPLLEDLLPNPIEEEDDHKGTWDTIIELHGRESVKYNQQNLTLEWQTRCLAARLLVHYDFLMLGIVDRSLE